MNTKKLTALLLAAMCLTAFSGCKDDKAQSSEAEAVSSTEAASVQSKKKDDNQTTEYKTFELDDFSLTVSDNYYTDETGEYSDSDLCIVNKDIPVAAAFFEGFSYAVTSYGHAESLADSLKNEPQCSDITFERCPEYASDVSVVNYISSEDDKTVIGDMYVLCEQDSMLYILVVYTDEFRTEAQQIADEVINGLEYTSDFYFPTEPQTFENNYFSVHYETEWVDNRKSSTDDNYELRLKYAHTDSMDNYLSSYNIKVITDGKHDDADGYASADFMSRVESQSKYMQNVSKDWDEIFGISASKVNYTVTSGDFLNYDYSLYFFEHNGNIYRVSISIPTEDDGTVAAAVRKLIDNTTLK